MPEYTINLNHYFDRPVAEVFAALADHDNLSTVFGVPVNRIKDGSTEPNGLGSVRRIGPPVVGAQETVTAFSLNDRIEYCVTKNGGPIRRHHGEMLFSEVDGGTALQWTIRFSSLPVVGRLLEKVLSSGINQGLNRI